MWEYSDIVKDHFHNPRNVGEIEDPDGVAQVTSMACGDVLKITLKVDKHARITDARCKVAGCVASIACASALTEMIKGVTLEEAVRITDQDIIDYLGGLPPGKTHAPGMAQETLERVVEDVVRRRLGTD
ncbi:MAG TPA: iron-sulfur cluster assembly scaffold protein [Syntrophorhabdaceae bacterium]|nr:iron-sulfur cluster assembly scaffold protein [Syntrophorhabdaceae bacterium]